ncbi:hypothetical protein Tsubulata_042773 [Turnera subulata]|uniref:Sm domain-containing protein n=1 Tax=Turnera subulata TaxID=218843 RepID=A0A9Q0J9U2_9ROSI|nr:hypothetical protein Tsubulata_042773 [Turnera subulata]
MKTHPILLLMVVNQTDQGKHPASLTVDTRRRLGGVDPTTHGGSEVRAEFVGRRVFLVLVRLLCRSSSSTDAGGRGLQSAIRLHPVIHAASGCCGGVSPLRRLRPRRPHHRRWLCSASVEDPRRRLVCELMKKMKAAVVVCGVGSLNLQLFFSYFKDLVGREVTVELKNDLAIRGTLHSVDQYLNIKLENTRVVDQDKYPHMVFLSSLVLFF